VEAADEDSDVALRGAHMMSHRQSSSVSDGFFDALDLGFRWLGLRFGRLYVMWPVPRMAAGTPNLIRDDRMPREVQFVQRFFESPKTEKEGLRVLVVGLGRNVDVLKLKGHKAGKFTIDGQRAIVSEGADLEPAPNELGHEGIDSCGREHGHPNVESCLHGVNSYTMGGP